MGFGTTEKSLTYKLPHEKVFEEVKKALSDCKFKIKESNKEPGLIKASTGMSFRSWGERIRVLVSETAEGTRVDAYSGAKAQLIDWGKSRISIDNFFAALNRRLEKLSKEPPVGKAIFCPSCGAELPPDARFCPECGKKIK